MTRPDPGLPQQKGLRTALRVIGPVVFIIGLVLTIAGIASFFAAFGSFAAGPPVNFWMAFVGLPLMAVGAWITQFAYLGPATRYVAGEVTPTLRDTLGALGVVKGEKVCASCGARNDPESSFCDSCGKPLSLVCASCGAQNDPDAQFCDNCGKPLAA